MYVGRKHTATVTGKKVRTFCCKHCKHTGDALVIGVGQGAGNNAYFLGEAGAKDRAASSARTAADENAELTLSLARCPSCHKRDDGALTALKATYIAGAVAVLILFPLFGLFIDALNHSGSAIWIFGVLAPTMAFVVIRMNSWKWTTIDNRVAFLEDQK